VRGSGGGGVARRGRHRLPLVGRAVVGRRVRPRVEVWRPVVVVWQVDGGPLAAAPALGVVGHGAVDGWRVGAVVDPGVGVGPGQRRAEVRLTGVGAGAGGAVVVPAAPGDGLVDPAMDPLGSASGALVREGVGEALDRARAGDDVAVAVEQAVEVAQALSPVPAQEGQRRGSQLDAADGSGADRRGRHGRLVHPRGTPAAVPGGEPRPEVPGVVGELVEVVPAPGREVLELAVEPGEPGTQGPVGVAAVGPQRRAARDVGDELVVAREAVGVRDVGVVGLLRVLGVVQPGRIGHGSPLGVARLDGGHGRERGRRSDPVRRVRQPGDSGMTTRLPRPRPAAVSVRTRDALRGPPRPRRRALGLGR